jgi:hypothetical protein
MQPGLPPALAQCTAMPQPEPDRVGDSVGLACCFELPAASWRSDFPIPRALAGRALQDQYLQMVRVIWKCQTITFYSPWNIGTAARRTCA